MRSAFDGICTSAPGVDQFHIKSPAFQLPELKLKSLFDIPIIENDLLPDGMFIIVKNRKIIEVL
jgi:hypothetical protein